MFKVITDNTGKTYSSQPL